MIMINAEINDTIEVILEDESLFIGDVVAKHDGVYPLNSIYGGYSNPEANKKIKIRNGDIAFWTRLSEVRRVVIKGEDSLKIASSEEELISL